jgi:hypothetical protein
MLLYFGSKSMMPAASSVVCESAHTCSVLAQATKRTYVRRVAQARCSDGSQDSPALAYASTAAESRSRIAAATRSAILAPVKPTSSCSSAGLPCVM